MPNGWMEAAANAGQSAIGGVIGLALGGIENRRQLEQQERLNQMSYEQHKLFTDYNTKAQMELWRNTNYSAQMAELKKAGLNPGLMYGHGGPGGSIQAATGGAGGPAATRASDGITGMGMGMQLAMMGAQKRLLEAQATKAEAEATKTSGVDTTETQTRIAAGLQGIKNAQAQEALTKMDTRLKELQGIITGSTLDAQIEQIEWMSQRALAELGKAENETFISNATKQDQIKIIHQEAIGAVLRNALTRTQTAKTTSDIKVNEAQIQKMAADIAQGWASLEQGNTEVQLKTIETELHKMGMELQIERPGNWVNVVTGALRKLKDKLAR